MFIYISGQMTGIKDFNKEAFFRIQRKLEKKYPNDEIINPYETALEIRKKLRKPVCEIPRSILMAKDIEDLLIGKKIYMLPGWEESKGARLEHEVAKQCGIEIFYVKVKQPADTHSLKKQTGSFYSLKLPAFLLVPIEVS